MCGINGITSDNIALVKKMNDATRHRGPDGAREFADEFVALGHNLLAISDDPDLSRQPVVSEDKRFVLVFNGEIYNYRELRKVLESFGEQFKTDSDTEVLFRGLLRSGKAFLSELDGMYAIAWYDRDQKSLLIARDPSGMKPVYYTSQNGELCFSSELRGLFAAGIEPVLDHESARLFFAFGYVPGERTLIKGVTKLRPGECLRWDIEKKEYTCEQITKKLINRKPENYSALRKIIGVSVEAHTTGKRPYGLFLSGGMDSSILLQELAERHKGVHTFTTRFATNVDEYNDDANIAAKLSKHYHTDHHELLITEDTFIAAIESAVNTLEEPRYNHSFPAYWLLAQEAQKQITVILDGSGGDELFHGYPRYLVAEEIEKKYHQHSRFIADLMAWWRGYRKGIRNFTDMMSEKDILTRWVSLAEIAPLAMSSGVPKLRTSVNELTTLLTDDAFATMMSLPDSMDATNVIARLDQLFWLADENYLRNDKIAMHFGMEGRFPLLGQGVQDAAWSYTSNEKLRNGTKGILRDAYKGVLPEFVTEKKKTGWNAPVSDWMETKLGAFMREVLSKNYYPEMNELIDVDTIRRESIDGVPRHDLSTLKKFLPFAYFMIWAREFKVRL